MRRTARFVCLPVLSLVLSAPLLIAGPPTTEVPFLSAQGDAGLMDGTFEYKIGERVVADVGVLGSHRNVDSWASKLTFPEDAVIAGGSAALGWKASPRWDWRLCGRMWKNLSDPSDKMTDEDTLLHQESEGIHDREAPRRVTADYRARIYSESDAELNAYGVDAKAELIRRTESGDWSIFVGHRYQKLEFDLFGLQGYQIGLGGLGMPDGALTPISGSTKVGTYDAETQMPYAGLGYYFDVFSRLHGALSAAYSPWMQVKDDDNHILRGKASSSDTSGAAVMLKASARVDLLENVFVRLTAEYLSMSADGDITEVFYRSTPEASAGMVFNGPISQDESQVAVYGSFGIEL
jgi:outer membrane protease